MYIHAICYFRQEFESDHVWGPTSDIPNWAHIVM
jgi:hypothetical protein